MTRRWIALAAMVLVFVSLNGCCHYRERPGLLARLRGQSATPSYSEPYSPSTMPFYPTSMPTGAMGNGSCCNGSTIVPGPGPVMGTFPGVTEQPPLPYPGISPGPMPPAGDQAKPLPAGPSEAMLKGKTGRVTNMPDSK